MFAVSALIPTGLGSAMITRVLSQVKADAPALLAVLGGAVAIAFVIHLLLRIIGHLRFGTDGDNGDPGDWQSLYAAAMRHGFSEDEAGDYADGSYDPDENIDVDWIDERIGEVAVWGADGDYDSGSADDVGSWAQFERDNYKAMHDYDEAAAENSRLMRSL